MNGFLIGVGVTLVLGVMGWFLVKLMSNKSVQQTSIFSSIERFRAIGQLSVYKVMTKEIVTESDHTWGEFGSRYLGWVLSGKKMAMIFEFEIDFRYNLQSPLFEIEENTPLNFSIIMPPCVYEVHIRDIRFYDEQGSKLLPWLLPDLLNGFMSGGFSEQEKNRLVDAAKDHAEKQAIELINKIQSEVQRSASSTLESISRAFGAESVDFKYIHEESAEIKVDVSKKLTHST